MGKGQTPSLSEREPLPLHMLAFSHSSILSHLNFSVDSVDSVAKIALALSVALARCCLKHIKRPGVPGLGGSTCEKEY